MAVSSGSDPPPNCTYYGIAAVCSQPLDSEVTKPLRLDHDICDFELHYTKSRNLISAYRCLSEENKQQATKNKLSVLLYCFVLSTYERI